MRKASGNERTVWRVGETQTIIAGLTQDNLIAPWVIKGAMDGEAFEAYIRNVLAPELRSGTVVICDNLEQIAVIEIQDSQKFTSVIPCH